MFDNIIGLRFQSCFSCSQGLKPTVEAFFIMMFTLMMVSYTATSMALAIATGHNVVAVANLLMTISFVFMIVSTLNGHLIKATLSNFRGFQRVVNHNHRIKAPSFWICCHDTHGNTHGTHGFHYMIVISLLTNPNNLLVPFPVIIPSPHNVVQVCYTSTSGQHARIWAFLLAPGQFDGKQFEKPRWD